MPSRVHRSQRQLVDRPLVDLTRQIVRRSAIQAACGAYGDVYKCRCKDMSGSPSLVAVKALRCFASQDPEEVQRRLKLNKALRRELGLWRRLEHPNIVPLLGVTNGFGPILAAVLPWMSTGSLHSFLKKDGHALTVDERLHLLFGIVSGLEYLHSNRVLHGDLHSGNVLIDEEHNPRISDFGLSSTIGKLQPGLSYLQRFSNTPGAVKWAAPEQLAGCELHPSGDIYSFGCIMFEVLSGDIPWKEANDIQVVILKVKERKLPSRPMHTAVGDGHWALMVRCWACPERQPTASALVGQVPSQTLCCTENTKSAQPISVFVFFFFLHK
ncbi:Protein kinase-like domain containing protein [Tylopilus felleus]